MHWFTVFYAGISVTFIYYSSVKFGFNITSIELNTDFNDLPPLIYIADNYPSSLTYRISRVFVFFF